MNNNILLIEDNIEMAENITAILELANYDVTYATNGKEGVDYALKSPPDLVLCDIMMPGIDGYGVLHILRNNAQTENTPFVFLTAKADKNDFRAGMNLGADDYITKPFDGIDLLKVIELRLKRSSLARTAFGIGSTDSSTFFNKTKELKEFEKLSGNRPVRVFRKGDMLFMETQTPNDLFYIKKGHVKTYKVNYDGKELITGIYCEGQFLGYIAVLEEKPYNENAEAMDDVHVSVIPKSEFMSLIYSSKDVAKNFIGRLTTDITEMENRLVEVAYQSVRQRVANELIKIESQLDDANTDKVIAISRKDISNIVGIATESLNRTLADFRDEKLIEIVDHGLKIVNKPKLEKVVRM